MTINQAPTMPRSEGRGRRQFFCPCERPARSRGGENGKGDDARYLVK
jgi:hypothetical protein